MRVNDILSELERQLAPLERQSEKAHLYLKKKDILIPIVIHMSANIFVNILNSYNLYVLVIGIFLVILSTIIIRICKD